jgi:hypothetical protein
MHDMRRWVVFLLLLGCNRAAQQQMIAANQPQPSTSLGEWVEGNDGTIGWRTATKGARAMFQRVSESVAKQCTVEAKGEAETRATCNGITVFVRHDATDLYRVCAKGTAPDQCQSAWSSIH